MTAKFRLTYQGGGRWMLTVKGYGWYILLGNAREDTHTIRVNTFEELIIHVPEILEDVELIEVLVLEGAI